MRRVPTQKQLASIPLRAPSCPSWLRGELRLTNRADRKTILRPRRSVDTMLTMAPNFVRATVREMDGYTPGEQPGPGESVVKLNTNENPFPPSPRVMRAIREIDEETLRRYPNPTADIFRNAAAKLLGVSMDMIL